MTTIAPVPASATRKKPNRVTSAPVPDLNAVAFLRDAEAATYLGLSVRTVHYLVAKGKLRRVWPRPRAARLTVESVTAYREAIEAGRAPKVWSQPGNPHSQPEPVPTPKKVGLLGRWGLRND